MRSYTSLGYIYEDANLEIKKLNWESLRRRAKGKTNPWVCVRDFNDIQCHLELDG